MRDTAAVLGSPIHHSLSPALHNHAYKQLGLPFKYLAIEQNAAEFSKWIRRALTEDLHWLGFSLTMPLKELICDTTLSDLVTLDPTARNIGSANTLYRAYESWHAKSTDLTGFNYLFKQHNISSVVLLGSGGTAKAALAALAELTNHDEIDVKLVRRNPEKDNQLQMCAPDLQIEFVNWIDFEFVESDAFVINTVPHSAAQEIATRFQGAKLLLDALYYPWPPALSRIQLDLGLPLISGLHLLCAQAIDQIKLMTGAEFDSEQMYQELIIEAKKLI
jgi:shikimate dehydrogenase